MLRLKTTALAAAMTLALAPGAKAEVKANTGNTLFADCTQTSGYYNNGFCLGYVVGTAHALANVCMPNGSTQGQMRDVVLRWLENNPDKRHYDASSIVAYVLGQAFPCAAKATS
jgi:hypothetical protein